MSQTTAPANRFLEPFESYDRMLSERDPAWMTELREEARTRFEQLGFPTPRLEAWKNTNVDAIATGRFLPADGPDDGAALPADAELPLDGLRLVFVNGRFSAQRSSAESELPAGLELTRLGDLASESNGLRELLERPDAERQTAFYWLNRALSEDGVVLRVGKGVTIEQPIQIVFHTTAHREPTATYPQVRLHAGGGSKVTLIETYCGTPDAKYLTNSATDLVVDANADVTHYRLQRESEQAFHISSSRFEIARDARLRTLNLDLGTRLARNDLHAVMNGTGAWSQIFGLYALHQAQHVDNHTTIEHAEPHGDSREVYKGVLGGRSRSVFNGRIIVREDAQKTDAKQSNPNILLSDRALAHTRPQLEIYADDVKCTHGATVGRLDEEALFYLRARGIGATEARDLMIAAFAGEVLELVDLQPIRERLDADLARRLQVMETR